MVFKKTKCVILSIVCVLFIYIFLGEPNLFEVVYLENTVEEGIRVVFFADLHLYFLRGFHERILEKIKSLNPDVIIFGGDALSYRTNVKDLEIFFSGIVDIAPTYTIFGNWEEHAPYHMKERYKDLGIFLLENTSTVFEAKGEKILLTGTESHYYFPVTEFPDTSEFLKSILIVHAPNKLENYPEILSKYDYVLSGHTHGGQICIPFFCQQLFEGITGTSYTYFRGIYDFQDTKIFISKGIGQWFPGRLFSLPDIGVIDIKIDKN